MINRLHCNAITDLDCHCSFAFGMRSRTIFSPRCIRILPLSNICVVPFPARRDVRRGSSLRIRLSANRRRRDPALLIGYESSISSAQTSLQILIQSAKPIHRLGRNITNSTCTFYIVITDRYRFNIVGCSRSNTHRVNRCINGFGAQAVPQRLTTDAPVRVCSGVDISYTAVVEPFEFSNVNRDRST